jgi:hypothetical protein
MNKRFFRHLKPATLFVVLAAFTLGGCGGIEVESSLLDAVGLNPSKAKRKEPKLNTRAGLIVPPALDRLPVPGSGAQAAVASADPSFPTNPETIAAANKKIEIAARKAACDPNNGDFGPRQSGKLDDFESVGKKVSVECLTPAKKLIGQ